ncbi:MAG: diaminopimelate epimerase [Planctomycetota bacterium]
MRFTKMHGIGNDYVIVNCFEEAIDDPSEMARRVSRRHYGIGSDGLILILPSGSAHLRMRIFNSDGSEAEMCGNGIRCVAAYAYNHELFPRETMDIDTGAGVKTVRLRLEDGRATGATVDMGKPGLERGQIPMEGPAGERVVDEALDVGGHQLQVTCVSMGNPHCVIPVEELDRDRCLELGPCIENHEAFPERTNVHFVKARGRDEVDVITWERGAGATLACGTGASAVCVAMNLLGETGKAITAHLPGGDLRLEWNDDGHVDMTGPAQEVFRGTWLGADA